MVSRMRANAEALALAILHVYPDVAVHPVDVASARHLARRYTPDVAVFDVGVADGLRLIRDLAQTLPALRIVVYGCSDDRREVSAWVDAGADRIVGAAATLREFQEAVGEAARITSRATVRVPGSQMEAVVCRGVVVPSRETLTRRERDVLQLIALELSNREIAETLCLELATVKNHVQHLMKKLGVHRRADAVRTLSGDSGKTQADRLCAGEAEPQLVRRGAGSAREAIFRNNAPADQQ